jgi:hypothetical protein
MKYTFKDLKKAQLKASRMHSKAYEIEQNLINQSPLKIGDTVKVLSNVTTAAADKLGKPIIGRRSKIEDVRLCGDHSSYTLAWRDAKGLRWCFTSDELKLITKKNK